MKLLSLHQAADATGLNYLRLWRACRAGRLAHHRVGAGYVLDADQFDALMTYYNISKEDCAYRPSQAEPQGTPT